MTHKIRGTRVVEEHAYYVNKLRQNVGWEKMNMTANCYVTNSAHQIQMNTPHENFLRTPLEDAGVEPTLISNAAVDLPNLVRRLTRPMP